MNGLQERQQLIAQAALDRETERIEARDAAGAKLNLLRGERINHLHELGDDTLVAEIIDRAGTVTYGIIANGRRINVRGEFLDEALLIAIAARNGIRDNDLYVTARAAGRALGITE